MKNINLKKIVLLFIIALQTMIYGQFIITGKITEDEKPVYGIEVILYDENKKPLKSNLTDDNGDFSIETSKGNYTLEARLLGKILYTSTIQMNNANVNIGTITVNTKSELGEVVLTGQKKLIERKVDRLVFNVENSLLATGSNAFDVLRIAPLINITNEQINIINKTGVTIMINDRVLNLSGDMLKNYLNTLASENIKSVEIITNPSAKYDAEGNGGIVNIKLKKPILEYTFLSFRSNYSRATFDSFGNGVNYMYRKNKLSTLADINYSRAKSLYTNDIKFNYSDNNTYNTVYKTKKSNSLNLLLNMDYAINKNQIIGFQVNLNKTKANSFEDNQSNIFTLNNNLINNFVINSDTKNPTTSFSSNINYELKLDSIGRKLNLDFDYFQNDFNRDNLLFSQKFANNNIIHNKKQINKGDQNIENYSFRANVEYPTKNYNLNFGTKISFTTFNNILNSEFSIENNNNFEPFSTQNDQFKYNENINALYIDVNKKLNEKWDLKIGLRDEFIVYNTNNVSNNTIEKNQYNKLFPTLYLNYNRNENNTFSFNYGRRIQRPRFSNLNPAKWYINENSIESGNPFLQPSFNHNFELSHTYKSKIMTYLSYTKTEQGFGQLTNHENNITQEFIRINYFNSNSFTFYQYYSFKLNKSITATFNYYISYFETNTFSELLEPSFNGFATNFKSTNTFIMNKNKTLISQLILEHNPASRNNENRVSSTSNIIFLIQYKPNKKLTLLLNAQDIFRTNFSTISSTTKNVNQYFTQYYDTQRINFSLNYNFGNEKSKTKQHKVSNEEEKNRAKD
jgi:outer membrane receptor protein involved in Fe transport